jgi:hypothetical protein
MRSKKLNKIFKFLVILLFLLISLNIFGGILPTPNEIPQKIKEKLKNYNYYQSSLEPGKYVIITVYSIYDLPKNLKL